MVGFLLLVLFMVVVFRQFQATTKITNTCEVQWFVVLIVLIVVDVIVIIVVAVALQY